MRKQRYNFCAFILLLAFSLVHLAGAQTNRPATSTKHSLWKIQGKTNTVYLLGSIHVLKPDSYPLPVPIEAAFSNAQIAVFETDIDKLSQPEAQLQIMNQAGLPPGQTLQQQLSPQTYAQFTNHLEGTGLPAVMFDSLKPSIAAMTLEVLEMEKLGVDPKYGVDEHFFKLTRQENKEIIPLETVDFQIQMVTEFSKEEGEQLMKATLKDIDNTKKELSEMTTAWQTGDSAKLEKLLNEAMQDSPAIFKRLVTDRSQRWVPKIEELVRSGTNAIVIVGAGHLVGKDGVVELLKKQGFNVTQL